MRGIPGFFAIRPFTKGEGYWNYLMSQATQLVYGVKNEVDEIQRIIAELADHEGAKTKKVLVRVTVTRTPAKTILVPVRTKVVVPALSGTICTVKRRKGKMAA
jgi:hypothetical protein